jgi:hypothetical protein
MEGSPSWEVTNSIAVLKALAWEVIAWVGVFNG